MLHQFIADRRRAFYIPRVHLRSARWHQDDAVFFAGPSAAWQASPWPMRACSMPQQRRPTTVSDRIVRGLHDGVEPVQAKIAAAVQAQARGAGYVALA